MIIGNTTTLDIVRDHLNDLQRLASPRRSKPRLTVRIARARRAR